MILQKNKPGIFQFQAKIRCHAAKSSGVRGNPGSPTAIPPSMPPATVRISTLSSALFFVPPGLRASPSSSASSGIFLRTPGSGASISPSFSTRSTATLNRSRMTTRMPPLRAPTAFPAKPTRSTSTRSRSASSGTAITRHTSQSCPGCKDDAAISRQSSLWRNHAYHLNCRYNGDSSCSRRSLRASSAERKRVGSRRLRNAECGALINSIMRSTSATARS